MTEGWDRPPTQERGERPSKLVFSILSIGATDQTPLVLVAAESLLRTAVGCRAPHHLPKAPRQQWSVFPEQRTLTTCETDGRNPADLRSRGGSLLWLC